MYGLQLAKLNNPYFFEIVRQAQKLFAEKYSGWVKTEHVTFNIVTDEEALIITNIERIESNERN